MSFDFSVNDDENMTFGRISKQKSSLMGIASSDENKKCGMTGFERR